MAQKRRRLDFDEFARELPRVFDQLQQTDQPILIERDGQLYRLARANETEDLFAGYDPVAVQEALRESAGALTGVDRDRLLDDIYAEREQDTRVRVSRPRSRAPMKGATTGD